LVAQGARQTERSFRHNGGIAHAFELGGTRDCRIARSHQVVAAPTETATTAAAAAVGNIVPSFSSYGK
jgi:hypothetical protein